MLAGYLRLGGMVNHDLQLRVLLGQGQYVRQVDGLDQSVKHQFFGGHGLQRRLQRGLQYPGGVGQVVQHGAQAFQQGVLRQRPYALWCLRGQQIHPSHHAQHGRVAVGLL